MLNICPKLQRSLGFPGGRVREHKRVAEAGGRLDRGVNLEGVVDLGDVLLKGRRLVIVVRVGHGVIVRVDARLPDCFCGGRIVGVDGVSEPFESGDIRGFREADIGFIGVDEKHGAEVCPLAEGEKGSHEFCADVDIQVEDAMEDVRALPSVVGGGGRVEDKGEDGIADGRMVLLGKVEGVRVDKVVGLECLASAEVEQAEGDDSGGFEGGFVFLKVVGERYNGIVGWGFLSAESDDKGIDLDPGPELVKVTAFKGMEGNLRAIEVTNFDSVVHLKEIRVRVGFNAPSLAQSNKPLGRIRVTSGIG